LQAYLFGVGQLVIAPVDGCQEDSTIEMVRGSEVVVKSRHGAHHAIYTDS